MIFKDWFSNVDYQFLFLLNSDSLMKDLTIMFFSYVYTIYLPKNVCSLTDFIDSKFH